MNVRKSLAAVAFAVVAACSSSSSEPPASASLGIEPATAEVAPGEVVSFGAFHGNTPVADVTWTVSEPGGGMVDANGNYTAPGTEGTFHVVANGTSEIATAAIKVKKRDPAAIMITITPKAASVVAGATLAFSASVTGTANHAVTWSVQEGDAGGTVSDAGLYTAPAVAGTYHVIARSAQDTMRLDTATVTVVEAPVTSGPQLYVSTSGNDSNPGTLAQPWRTIQKAMSSATPGSTVNIRGGTYQERLVMNVSGSAGSPITFQPYGFVGTDACGGYTGVACAGEQVVLDYSYLGTNTSTSPLLLISGKHYVTIQGITMQNFTNRGAMQQGIRVDGASTYIDLRWMRFYNMRCIDPSFGAGAYLHVRFWSGSDHCRVTNSVFDTIWTNISETVTWAGASYGFAEKNYFVDNDQIQLHTYTGAHDFVFRDNRFQWCGVKRDGSKWYGIDMVALYNDGGHHGVFEGNYFQDCSTAIQSMSESSSSPAGITVGPSHDMAIRNNVIVRPHAYGMVIGTWYSSTSGSANYNHDWDNNVVYDCAGGAGILVRPFDTATTRVRNNIVARCSTTYVNGVGWNVGTSFDYNLYYGGGSGPDAHKVLADPQFANPGAGDFTLLSGSPAVDAGDPATTTFSAGTFDFLGLPRIVGGRVDIGADERQ